MKALILLIVLVVALGGGAYWYFFWPQAAAEEPQTVMRKTIRKTAHGSGLIEGSSVTMRMHFPWGGYVDRVLVKEGQMVKGRDLLAQLSPIELDDKIKLQEIEVKELKAKRDALAARKSAELIEQAQDDLRKSVMHLAEVELEFSKLQTPQGKNDRLNEYETLRRNFESAQRRFDLAEADLKALKSHPTPDEMAVVSAKLEAAKQRKDQSELGKALMQEALTEYDKVKRGPSPEDIAAATARLALARTELDNAEAARKKFDEKPSTDPAAEAALAAHKRKLEQMLADAKADETAKRAALEKLRHDAEDAEVREADAKIERAQTTLKLLERNKEGYDLHAPFDALITKRLVEEGALLQPFEDVVQLIDFSRKRVRAEFDITALLSLAKPGLTASIKSRAFGKDELPARVLPNTVKVHQRNVLFDDPSLPKGGEVAEVLMELDPPQDAAKKELFDALRPGLRVEADIVLESRADVVSVPKSYVASEMSDDGTDRQFVWKTEINASKQNYAAARKVEVKCGMRDDYYVEILEGLKENDLVVKPRSQGK
ncbi:MAG TPA: hypothetical protein VKX17_26410 [Planctomycetota bacterium]|nr:hypothetical protein [Planctomycetota bacterium]